MSPCLGVDPTRLEYSQEANRACLVAETYLTINAIADFPDEVYFQEDHPYQPDQRAASRLSELREIFCGLFFFWFSLILEKYTSQCQNIKHLITKYLEQGGTLLQCLSWCQAGWPFYIPKC